MQYVDFYRYCDVGLDDVLGYLEQKVSWIRPEDTGRSTNCLINDVGIYVHQKERRFHNYALPYSWDVRLGHKTREQALDELDDKIDPQRVRRILFEVGYDSKRRVRTSGNSRLASFFVSAEDIAPAELSAHLGKLLPSSMIPASFRRIESLPLTANGKLDERALPSEAPADDRYTAPEGPVEELLIELWEAELGCTGVGSQTSFFELGGTSLGAMEVMARLCRELDLELGLETIFERPTIRELAAVVEERLLADVGHLLGEEDSQGD